MRRWRLRRPPRRPLTDFTVENPIDKITAWFNEQDDGEFACPARTHPFQVIGPTPSTQAILYTTKAQCVLALKDCETALATGMIGRYGLPNEEDVAWLRVLAGERTVYFLGDGDPVDLLIDWQPRCDYHRACRPVGVRRDTPRRPAGLLSPKN